MIHYLIRTMLSDQSRTTVSSLTVKVEAAGRSETSVHVRSQDIITYTADCTLQYRALY